MLGEQLLLALAGVGIGAFSVVFGGGFFLSVPLMQIVFPGASVGRIIGNLKVASAIRGLGTIATTRRDIRWRECALVSIPIVLGSWVGVELIADLAPIWIVLTLVVGIILSEFAARIARGIPRSFLLAAFLVCGFYIGVFGAGSGVILVSLLQLRHPEDSQIAWVKIQARAVEFVASIAAILAHALHGNLLLEMWLAYSLGSFLGGLAGGVLLTRLERTKAKFQRLVLRGSYALSLSIAIRTAVARE